MPARSALLAVLMLGAAAAQADPAAWILTTDYGTFGRVRSFSGSGPWTVSADLATIPGDAVGRHHGGLVYIVGRKGSDLLQVYDPAAGFALVREFSLGAGRNPQDIAFDTAGEAYIPCYDEAVLLRVDVAGETILGTYSTAPFADADGLPETAWCAAAGDLLYIACQKLDRGNWYGPSGPGAILVFDMAAEQWVDMDPVAAGVQPIALVGGNPYTRLVLDGDRLAVGCAGWFGLADGGIELVDLTAGVSLGYAVTEAELGGDVLVVEPDGACWLALVSDASFTTSVRRACAAGVAVLDTGTGYVHADLWLQGGVLHLLDRTPGAAGLRVLDPQSGAEHTAGAISTGLPPFMFVPPVSTPSGAPLPTVAGLRLGAPYPNPCNPAARIAVTGTAGTTVAVMVHDLRGRRVGGGAVLIDAQGHGTYVFRGVDGRGTALPAGIYQVVARDGSGRRAATAVTLVK
ncbi:MAG: hypothetical protein IH621_05415 [Krumholzibacteria bacterium]|nr:hypothetical protein [Candidatus Krumholzibacteria bacterium]